MNRCMELLLPPSVNALYISRGGYGKRIYSSKARDYMNRYSKETWIYLRKINHSAISEYFYLDIHWTLPRKDCDSHNYEKGLFDMLEKAGFVQNDKYIMARTQSVEFSSKEPKVTICWDLKEEEECKQDILLT